jgi:histidinol-phosphate aminotransferase
MKTWLQNIRRVDVLPRPGGTDLRYSEWTESIPPKLFKKFIKTLTWEDFALYPDTNLLKNKLAEHHSVSADHIYIGPGSAECISNVFECFAENQSVTTTEPCFPMYDVYAAQCNLLVNKVGPKKNFTYDAKQFLGGSFIVLSRPSNPIGYFFTRTDILTILKQNPDRWVLVDEAYIGYAENADDITNLVTTYPNLIISRSFSKVFGAAGARIGYLLSNPKNIDIISKLRPMYEITGPSQKYAMFMLDNPKVVEKYCKQTIKEKKKLIKLCNAMSLKTISSQGNWIHVEQKEWFVTDLELQGIHVKKDVTLPNTKGLWLRITVGPGVTQHIKKI